MEDIWYHRGLEGNQRTLEPIFKKHYPDRMELGGDQEDPVRVIEIRKRGDA